MSANPFSEIGPRRFGYYFLQGYNAHTVFCKWVEERRENISTVLEVGCGCFEYYSYFFQSFGMTYTGLDHDQSIVDFRKNINPEQGFICADFFRHPCLRYDLVFHHMVLSGLIGMKKNLQLLERTVKASYRYGFGVFWNTENVNEQKLVSHLSNLGCKDINCFWKPTGLPYKQPQYQLILNWEK